MELYICSDLFVLIEHRFILLDYFLTWTVMLNLQIVDQFEYNLLVLSSNVLRCQFGQCGRVRVVLEQELFFLLVLLNHIQAQVKEATRVGDNTLANLKFHALPQGDLHVTIDLSELFLQLFHLK